jgi:hypothetical protein
MNRNRANAETQAPDRPRRLRDLRRDGDRGALKRTARSPIADRPPRKQIPRRKQLCVAHLLLEGKEVVFVSSRFDALVCSSNCRLRLHRRGLTAAEANQKLIAQAEQEIEQHQRIERIKKAVPFVGNLIAKWMA